MKRTTAIGQALQRWVQRGLARGGAWLLRALAATWRVERDGPDPLRPSGGGGVIGAIWHCDILVAAALFRESRSLVPVSRSRDGDWIAAALEALGYPPPPRGSSSRGGGVALRALVRAVRRGEVTCVPTDGPRGPAEVTKPGVVALAELGGVPVTPVAFAARPEHRFGSWDRTRLPWPFARVVCAVGDPVTVSRPDAGAEPGPRRQLGCERIAAAQRSVAARAERALARAQTERS